ADGAAMLSAVAGSEETGEKSRSSPSPAPAGSMGAPGHTLMAGVAGRSAARAAVSSSGGVGPQMEPAAVSAATAAMVPMPSAAAVRLDRLVFCRRRRAASRRRARSVEAVSDAVSAVVSAVGSGVGSTAGFGAGLWSGVGSGVGSGLSFVMDPPCGAAGRRRDGYEQHDDA